MINTPLGNFTESGLELATGEKREYGKLIMPPAYHFSYHGAVTDVVSWMRADCILAATGFETNFRPPFPIIGLDGADLKIKWTADYAQTFGGVVTDGFPNFFIFMGPSSPVGQGSILSAIEMQSHYFSQLLDKIQESRIKTLSIKPERVEQYNIHLQSLMPVSKIQTARA